MYLPFLISMVAARIPCLLFDPPFELEKISSDVFSLLFHFHFHGVQVSIFAQGMKLLLIQKNCEISQIFFRDGIHYWQFCNCISSTVNL